MGINVEFNPDLALRNIRAYHAGSRTLEECIPENLEVGKEYPFLKKGYRIYWVEGPVPLCETEGEGKLSPPLAAIQIIKPFPFLRKMEDEQEVWTSGHYRVIKIKGPADTTPLFDGWELRR
jgi:hypothetical protein